MTQSLNTIPTAAEDSALAPKQDTTTKLKGLVAGAALAAFVLYKHWPEYLSCDDLSDPDHVIHSMNKHCDEHDLPKNACVINVCGSLDK